MGVDDLDNLIDPGVGVAADSVERVVVDPGGGGAPVDMEVVDLG